MAVDTTANGLVVTELKEHPIYWFDDGLLTLRIQNALYKLHRSLICRHSRVLLESVGTSSHLGVIQITGESTMTNDYAVKTKEVVFSKDFDELLRHLYHDEYVSTPTFVNAINPSAGRYELDPPLNHLAPFDRVVAVLRVSSPNQLDFPLIHELARSEFERVLPPVPLTLKPETHPLYDGLLIASKFDFPNVRKAILYTLVTTHHFDDNVDVIQSESSQSPQNQTSGCDGSSTQSPGHFEGADAYVDRSPNYVSKEDRALCEHLLERVISHFTPILYTPANGNHMACTNVFADKWMPYVIQPSLDDDGVYKPLETLEKIKNIDWEKEGLCSSCATEKREEWSRDQADVWALLDDWIRYAA